ncbi:glycosyltransferase [uncultured Alsobacter sp.]|uniref:glycosyltransferase n=1 Tax=uncultured Alsobacter sp. TaxID=1748258 RepID=UPI0025E5DD02|nr:glycosyltransferase [uncultured Alsobacter sp.]
MQSSPSEPCGLDGAAAARRPSVLHLFKVYYPDLCGGALTVIRDICSGLKQAFTPKVLVCSRSGGGSEIVIEDVPVERVHSMGDLFSLPLAPSYPVRLWKRIAEHDLLALHAPFPLADLVFACGLGRRRPLVVHWHADVVTHWALRWLVHPLMRRTLRRAQAIVVSDPILVRTTPLLQEFASKCHAVPFGVDVDKYGGADGPAQPVNERGRLVLACGRLVPYKGFDVLVRAAVGQAFDVWIVGEGRERARLTQLIEELGVGDRVHLLGQVPDGELAKLMLMADVFVMPSVSNAETFGIAQLEAMAAGRPVVNTALDTAVPRVARHGIEALTVPPGDPARLASAIAALIADPDLRRRMGAAARRRAVTVYPTEAFRTGIEAVYRRAVARAPLKVRKPAGSGPLGVVRIAGALAWSDIRHRYARSILGPFWMTLQMSIMVAVLGSVLGHVSGGSAFERLPILAASLTAWMFFSGVILDATTALQDSASLIKDRALPPVTFLLQCTFRQGLFALHNACVPLLLWLVLTPHSLSGLLPAIPGLLLFAACTFGLGLLLGTLATRFRDLKPIIESTLTLGFLSSPIVWTPEMLNSAATVIRINPLTHLFAVWREPLFTGHLSTASLAVVLAGVGTLALASLVVVARLRRAAFWV